jgi:hypothetical protein
VYATSNGDVPRAPELRTPAGANRRYSGITAARGYRGKTDI